MRFDSKGDLLCDCGEVMSGGVSVRGDNIVSCARCQKSYETGSYRHNPSPEIRQVLPAQYSTLRYVMDWPNWIVKDGVKEA